MIPIRLSDDRKNLRWWQRLRRRVFLLELPECWEDVQPPARRQRWWRWNISLPRVAAQRAMMRDLLRDFPRRIGRIMSPLDFAALAHLLSWTEARPQCDQVPIPHWTHRGRMYHLPTPKGANVTCLEYALADDYYKQFTGGDSGALALLVATICREEDKDTAATLRRGDRRVLLFDKAEIEDRSARLLDAPADMQVQALLYFGGLKQYVHRVYGKWLFEQEEDEEEENGITPGTSQGEKGGPDFGWWGILQQVAEGGVFGKVQEVYQASLHEVCVWLVRKRIEADNMAAASRPSPKPVNDDDDGV